MKTDYIGHDRAYQRKRSDPNFVGWNSADDVADVWRHSWLPLLQKKAFPQQGKLLELGCGAGNLSICFAQAGYTITGVDIAPTAIEWARDNAAKANANIDFIQADILQLSNIADDSFDIAVDGHCLHCIIGRDHRTRWFQAAHRILKPGGILAINTMCNEIPNNAYWQQHFDPHTRCTLHNGVATRYAGWSNDILKEIIQANFRILNAEILPPQDEDALSDLQVIAQKQ